MPPNASLTGTMTEATIPNSTAVDQSAIHDAVQKAYINGPSQKTGCDHNGEDSKPPASVSSFLVSSFEFLVMTAYKTIYVALHLGLAVSFLAFVSVRCLGNFHDNYFVTILNRARRTDSDLKSEITYFNRRCGMSDVTTSKHHHIHFGNDYADSASEMFIDPSRFLDDNEVEEDFATDHNNTIKYQQKRHHRRRRRFALPHNIWEAPQLKPIPPGVAKKAGKQAVHSMMKHGFIMIPQILSDATIGDLRDFLVDKNERVHGTSDQYPMSQALNRVSYGIESTEHPSVVRALKEIHDHGIFAEAIKNLVGDENPALSEITAITSWAGANSQGWHPDVKPDGNGVMFGRTYSHSYSLFLPLQDTTGEMGATDLCPGTHMCADDDLWEMCNENKIGLHEVRKAKPRDQYRPDEEGTLEYLEDVRKEGVWRAGDGALLNQQAWHRGTAHTDMKSDDRVVFIVSFLKRPHAEDPRQLARGTYFHQKWLNWGSTWEDMSDTLYSLKRPWNVLRCLHLYKPSDRDWGYDLFTATTLRIANQQMGGEPDDLEGLIENVMVRFKYPTWLQGLIDYEREDAWQVYLSQTIQKTRVFLYSINQVGHVGFLIFLGVASILAHLYNRMFRPRKKRSVFAPVLITGVRRFGLTHGSILALGLYIWHVVIKSSQWAIDIDSGKTLMRPFPPVEDYFDTDPNILGKVTTLPRRSDVLIGTRFHTKAIGAYRTWLEYHPANRVLDGFVESYGGSGKFYQTLLRSNNETSLSLTHDLVSSAMDTIQKRRGGRFLMQDYRYGDWKILSDTESREYLHSRLYVGSGNSVLGAIKQETEFLLDRYRFGVPRKTLSMSRKSQLFLFDLSKALFTPAIRKEKTPAGKNKVREDSNPFAAKSVISLQQWRSLTTMDSIVTKSSNERGIRRYLLGNIQPQLFAGVDITFFTKDSAAARELGLENQSFPGSIIGLSTNSSSDGSATYQIAIDGQYVETIKSATLDRVRRDMMKVREPVSEGSRVRVPDPVDDDDEESEPESFDGTVVLVMADGSIDVKFDSGGEIGTDIPFSGYTILTN